MIGQTAAKILGTLQANPEIDVTTVGDASLLPAEMPLTSLARADEGAIPMARKASSY